MTIFVVDNSSEGLSTELLLILVQALTEIKIPQWRPLSMDTSVGADLFRIEFYKNYILSQKDEKIEDDVFTTMSTELTEVCHIPKQYFCDLYMIETTITSKHAMSSFLL